MMIMMIMMMMLTLFQACDRGGSALCVAAGRRA